MNDNGETNSKTAEPLPQVTNKDAAKVWLIVIWTLAIVLVISVIVLGLSVFITPAKGGTTGQTILTVITTIIGFLAGLFAPSPVEKNKPS